MKRYSRHWFAHHLRNNRASLWLGSHRTLYLMVATRESRVPPVTDLPFRINCWEDLERFEETERWHNRGEFLARARERLDRGTDCITLVQDGQLAFVDWMKADSKQALFNYVGHTVVFPPRSSTQFSGYVHPAHRGRGLFLEGMRRVLDHLFEKTDTRYAMAAVEGDKAIPFHGHLKVGFDTIATLETRRVLGRTRYAGLPISSRFALVRVADGDATWRIEPKGGDSQ